MEIQTSKEYPLHPNLKMHVKWQAKRNFFYFFLKLHTETWTQNPSKKNKEKRLKYQVLGKWFLLSSSAFVQLWCSAVSGFGVKGREGGEKVAAFDMDKDQVQNNAFALPSAFTKRKRNLLPFRLLLFLLCVDGRALKF
jgi:hypothetical protein